MMQTATLPKPEQKEKLLATKKAALVLRALNHKLRQRLLTFLEANPSTNVTTLYIKFRLEQSVASQHLRILRDASLVIANRRGKEIRYSANTRRMQQVVELAERMIEP